MISSRIYIVFTVMLLIGLTLKAQSSNWVQAEGQCVIANIIPEEARQIAIERARSEAIKEAVGVNISEEIFRVVRENTSSSSNEIHDIFSRLNVSTSYGKIVSENIILDTLLIYNDLPIIKVLINAEVVKEEGVSDPSFRAEIIMSKDVFYDKGKKESDKLDFNLWATQDCYFYLFNIMSNDSVQVLIPNLYIKDNYYSVLKDEQAYEKDLKNLSFHVAVPANKSKAVEGLYLVALKDKIDFLGTSISTERDGIIQTYKAAIKDIQSWLVKIPLNKRTDAMRSFEIRKLE